jgi:predicted RNA binding protein YcfA (HicA-like mRNA interferase family)
MAIFAHFGFEVARVRGSHHRLERLIEGNRQTLTVAVHGHKDIPLPTLRSIYRDACRFIPEDKLRPHFYTD